MLLQDICHTLARLSNVSGKSGISGVGKQGVLDFLTWKKFLSFWEYFCSVSGDEHTW